MSKRRAKFEEEEEVSSSDEKQDFDPEDDIHFRDSSKRKKPSKAVANSESISATKQAKEKGLLLRTHALPEPEDGVKISKKEFIGNDEEDLDDLDQETIAELKKLRDIMETEGTLEDSDAEDSDDEGEVDQKQVQRAISEMQLDTKRIINDISEKREKEQKKAQHVFNQKILYDTLLKLRIHLQKPLAVGNRLPQHDMFQSFVSHDEEIAKQMKELRNEMALTMADLFDLQSSLFKQNKTNVAPAHSIDGNELLEQLEKARKEGDSDPLNNVIWKNLQSTHIGYKKYRSDSLDRWAKRTQLQNTGLAEKELKTINLSILKRTETALIRDKQKLLKRTQEKRFTNPVLGKRKRDTPAAVVLEEPASKQQKPAEQEVEIDTEIFDDKDFYQKILRDLIEDVGGSTIDKLSNPNNKSNQTLSSALLKVARESTTPATAKNRLQLQRALNEQKRKIKFEEDEKIVSFMAPAPPVKEVDVNVYDALFKNLFGGKTVQL